MGAQPSCAPAASYAVGSLGERRACLPSGQYSQRPAKAAGPKRLGPGHQVEKGQCHGDQAVEFPEATAGLDLATLFFTSSSSLFRLSCRRLRFHAYSIKISQTNEYARKRYLLTTLILRKFESQGATNLAELPSHPRQSQPHAEQQEEQKRKNAPTDQ